MTRDDAMTFEEQISAFMDHALGVDEEAEFLHILSISPDKRDLFHSFMNVRTAFVSDMQATTVPAHLDAAILNAVLPSPVPVSSAAPGMWTARRLVTAALLGIACFTGGLLTHSYFDERPDTLRANGDTALEPGERSRSRSITGTDTQAGGAEGGTLGSGGATDAASRAGTAAPRATIVYRNVYVTRVDTVAKEPALLVVHDTLTTVLRDTLVRTELREAPPAPVAAVGSGRVQLPDRSAWRNIDIEIQREHLNTYPYINFSALGAARARQDVAVFAGYAFDERHSAGLMIGQRHFSQEFYQLDRDSMYLYQQQPLLTYAGGFYRYSLPILPGVVPQFMLQLGGSDLGPIVGGRLTVKLTPFRYVSFVAGTNATMLIYRYKGRMFTSQTLGLLYGLNIQF